MSKRRIKKDGGLPSIPKSQLITEFLISFLKHLNQSNLEAQKAELEKDKRIFDSLARLVEGDGICSAVTLDENTLLCASNLISANSSQQVPSRHVELIDLLMAYFSNDFRNEEAKIEFLASSALARTQQIIHNTIDIKEIKYYLREYYTEPVRGGSRTVDEIKDKQIAKDPFNKKIIESIARLVRDLEKLEKYFLDNFNQTKSLVKALSIGSYRVLYVEKPHIHAEMRVLNELLKSFNPEVIEGHYIGISKLACAHCTHTLKIFKMLDFRGSHSRVFNWKLLDTLQENAEFLRRFIGDKAYEKYERLSEGDKKLALQYVSMEPNKVLTKLCNISNFSSRREMVASDSASDVEIQPVSSKHFDSGIERLRIMKTRENAKTYLEALEVDFALIKKLKKHHLIFLNAGYIDLIENKDVSIEEVLKFDAKFCKLLARYRAILDLVNAERIPITLLKDLYDQKGFEVMAALFKDISASDVVFDLIEEGKVDFDEYADIFEARYKENNLPYLEAIIDFLRKNRNIYDLIDQDGDNNIKFEDFELKYSKKEWKLFFQDENAAEIIETYGMDDIEEAFEMILKDYVSSKTPAMKELLKIYDQLYEFDQKILGQWDVNENSLASIVENYYDSGGFEEKLWSQSEYESEEGTEYSSDTSEQSTEGIAEYSSDSSDTPESHAAKRIKFDRTSELLKQNLCRSHNKDYGK